MVTTTLKKVFSKKETRYFELKIEPQLCPFVSKSRACTDTSYSKPFDWFFSG